VPKAINAIIVYCKCTMFLLHNLPFHHCRKTEYNFCSELFHISAKEAQQMAAQVK
jgi:hypothetical protein